MPEPKDQMVLEICVDSVESAKAAESGGADRIELCSGLLEGGITPGAGLIATVRNMITIPVFVMVRPRGGDFFYSADEFTVMKQEVITIRGSGADGVVLGILMQDGKIDVSRTSEMVELARPLGVTFHRAFDWSGNLEEAFEKVIATGADRILTSGGSRNALEGSTLLASLVSRSQGRIKIVVCGNVRPQNIAEVAMTTGASEFHASLRKKETSPVTYLNPRLAMGEQTIDACARYAVDAKDVHTLRHAMGR